MKASSLTVFRTLFLFSILAGFQLNAQISTHELPYTLEHSLEIPAMEPIVIPFNENMIEPGAAQSKYPMFAGVSLPVQFAFSQKAAPVSLPDGTILWQLKIHVPGAKALGIVFSDFFIREKDKFFIYDDTGTHHIGAFTSANNTENGIFSTYVLPASTLILEYHSQNNQNEAPGFVIDEMIYLMSPYTQHSTEEKSSGDCNVNINCTEGDLWQKQKRGVARILLKSGNSWYNCTGSLVNNTLNDGTPYFLTSDHCGANASEDDLLSWQFYFNYEYPGCTNNGTAPQNMMIPGAVLVSHAPINDGTDFKLLELTEAPPLSWNPYFNGWTLSSRSPETGTGIHHPSGDAKKISTYTTPLSNATFTNGMPNGYWRVVWAETASGHGVTEGGSSGSPIFDSNGLITGTLTGGGASCSSPNLADYYGKFYLHWEANGNADDEQLIPWLAPTGDAPDSLFGFDPNALTNFVIVDINPPLAGTVSGDGYYAENENVFLKAQANEGYEFLHWSTTQGQVVSTNQEYMFVMPQTELNLIAHFDLENSADNNFIAEQVSVYPNPATETIMIDFGAFKEKVWISITNLTGQNQITPFEINTQEMPHKAINLGFAPDGMYFLTLASGSIVHTFKIVLKQ